MAKQTAEIVAPTDLDDIPDGSTYQKIAITEATRLEGCDENAEVNPTGAEMQTAIEGLSDAARTIMISDPQSGEYKIHGVHRNAAGNPEYDYDDVAV